MPLEPFRKTDDREHRKRKIVRINELVEELTEARATNPKRARDIEQIFELVGVELSATGHDWRAAEVE